MAAGKAQGKRETIKPKGDARYIRRDAKGRIYYATANPGKLYRLSADRAARGTYESETRDAGMVASARAPMAASSPLQIAMTWTVPMWFCTRCRFLMVSSARLGPSSTNRGRAVRK